jgi:GNAT superfamily N-acetyltransferase
MSNKIYYLQQSNVEQINSKPLPSTIQIEEIKQHQASVSRQFYLEVGQHWQWNDKRQWSEQDWNNYTQSKTLRTFAAYQDEQFVGYFELEKHADESVEIAYFGLAKHFLGQGIGGGLLSRCLYSAWQWQASRVWVHTCDLDHPSALANYQARGMELYKTECDS